MADEDELDVDVEGDFDVKIGSELEFAFDTNEPPSQTVHLQPEFTQHPWVLEQGWSVDNCTDEKSKATIEKMLMEEHYYMNGHHAPGKGTKKGVYQPAILKRTWAPEEKDLFLRGLEIYGRSWTKISEIIQTRTPLQVKNFAQQYFKQQAKLQQSKLFTSEAKSQPSQTLANALISVTTAQPTVTISSPKCSNSPVKSLHKNYTGRSPVKSKAVKTVRQIIQDEYGETKKDIKATSTIKSLISSDPTVKRIEKVSDDEDIEIDVEFDDDMTGDEVRGVACHEVEKISEKNGNNEEGVSELGDKAATVTEGNSVQKCLEVCDEDSLPASSLEISVSDKDEGTGTINSECKNQDSGIEMVSCLVSEVKQSESIILGSDGDVIKENEPVDIEGKDLQQEQGMKDFNERDSSTDSTSISSSQMQSIEIKAGLKPQVSDSTDKLIECPEKLGTKEFGTGNESTSHEEMKLELCVVTSGNCVAMETEAKLSGDETSGVEFEMGSPQVDETEEDENGDQSMKSEEENPSGGYLATSTGGWVFFPPPTQEFLVEKDAIVDQERDIHSEFFIGRLSKTPERYRRIRNYIIDAWEKCKPEYLNKTSVRPGLKNCGDVNSIGRIHAYLEQVGAINFGCEQTNYYRRVRPPVALGPKQKKPEIRADRTDPIKSRKRRVRDVFGEWIDESELEGRTIEHKEENRPHSVSRARVPKIRKDTYWYDPFKLLPCEHFPSERPAPFLLDMSCSAMAVMDVHAHTSKTEVIGLLGGHYNKEKGALEILTAEPCNSLSTGMQCEMDPISQTQAMDRITNDDFSVVGWYHSHPTFAPNPSVRDIETQEKFQDWFSQGGLPFIGVIVNPYNKASQSPCSTFKCLMVRKEKHADAECHSPFQFDYKVISTGILLGQLLLKLRDLIQRSAKSSHRVEMLRLYKRTSDVTCLEKMLLSLKFYLRNQIDNMDKLVVVLRDLTTETFMEEDMDS